MDAGISSFLAVIFSSQFACPGAVRKPVAREPGWYWGKQSRERACELGRGRRRKQLTLHR